MVDTADTTEPVIGVSHIPLEPTELDDVTVRATVTDDSGVVVVIVGYSIDSGVTWTNVSMNLSGGLWTAPIPRQDVGVTVQYKVYAKDTVDNWGTAEDSYTIVSSVPPLTPLSIVITIGEILGAMAAIYGAITGFRHWKKKRSGV
jgi:hypothetical protein